MKKKQYLELYKKWLKDPNFHNSGLCDLFKRHDINLDELKLFQPTKKEFGLPNGCLGVENYYWAMTGERGYFGGYNSGDFTPLRQTILLFMACMAGEM